MQIHSTAIIAKDAVLGEGCRVGPYALIESGVVLGDRCEVAGHAVIRSGAVLADEVQVDHFAAVGGDPQSLSFDRALTSSVRIGKGVVIREGCTVHRSMYEGGATVVGEGCLLMAQAHVAHDCKLDAKVVLANNVMLAGHVEVGAHTFIGGGAAINQFCRLGAGVMVAGNATMTADVPPYLLCAERNQAHGLNLVGLRRAHLKNEVIADLKRCYRAVYFGGGNVRKKAALALDGGELGTTAEGTRFLRFFAEGQRGFIQSRNDS